MRIPFSKFLQISTASFAILLFTHLSFAQTPHLVGWHTKKPFRESFERCFQKTVEAANASSLRNVRTHDGWVVSGHTDYLRVAISCIQVSEGVMINIQVAGEANHEPDAVAMRDYLKGYLLTGSSPQMTSGSSRQEAGGYSGPQVWTRKPTYRPSEPIEVEFSNLPGDRSDEWITIVPYDAEPGKFRQWKYTSKKQNGSLRFMGLPRGRYEVRYHYSNGDKQVRARQSFTVER